VTDGQSSKSEKKLTIILDKIDNYTDALFKPIKVKNEY